MEKKYCEKVKLSAMAIFDKEKPLLTAKEIEEHIASCNDCRRAIEQLQGAVNFLDGKHRKSYEVNVWETVEHALRKNQTVKESMGFSVHFIFLGLILVILKIIGVLPAFNYGAVVKVVSVFVIIAFFFMIKQNPFSISHNLQTKGDIKC